MTIWLLSYPRCGNHLTRAYIEFLTQTKTLGCQTNPQDTPICLRKPDGIEILEVNTNTCPYIIKVHYPKDIIGLKEHDKLILLLRSPYECIQSQGNTQKTSYATEFSIYERNVIFFVNFANEKKIILYYEDLKTHPDIFIQTLGNFLNVDESKIKKCIEKKNEIETYALSTLQKNPVSQSDIHYYAKKKKIMLPNPSLKTKTILSKYFN